MSNSVSFWRKRWLLPLLAFAVFASYAPALRDGFVWDDNALILRDPFIRSWRLIPEGFQHFLFTDATASDFYRPVQRLSYTIEYWAVAFRPKLFHLDNILLHLSAAIALFLFANELLKLFGAGDRWRRPAVAIAVFIWALHPVQSAAVIYVSGRADLLAALFGFAGLFCGLRSLRGGKSGVWLFTIAATVAFLLSALSKELGLIFPLLWIAILAARKNWIGLRHAIAIVVSVAVIYLSLRLPAEHIPAPPPRSPVPLLVRPLIVARAAAEYTGLLLLPLNLHMDRDVETHPTGFSPASLSRASWRELQNLLGLILIAAALVWLWRARRSPPIFICLLLALLCYLPVSCIVGLNATVAEHWLYLPSAFLFLAASLSLVAFVQQSRDREQRAVPFVLSVACLLWVLFLGARTFVRTFDWKDQRTFLTRTIAAGGDSSRMLTNLGGLDLAEGKLTEARKNLEAALKKDPGQPFALLNLAAVAVKENDFKKAHDLLQQAAQIPIAAATANELLAVLEYKETGHVNLMRMRLAARTGPPDWPVEQRYINTLDEVGYPDRAIAELKACLATEWYRAESWQMLSGLLAKAGKTEEAARILAIARQYDVHLPPHR